MSTETRSVQRFQRWCDERIHAAVDAAFGGNRPSTEPEVHRLDVLHADGAAGPGLVVTRAVRWIYQDLGVGTAGWVLAGTVSGISCPARTWGPVNWGRVLTVSLDAAQIATGMPTSGRVGRHDEDE